ncbi:urease accessory protein UreD [Dyadobacter sp. CY356]|uniref:urease accessory protein UreD n=1 Tax=Dyadobacter sp. CY356 TaxID=2906442 RepID=UPI001F2ED5F2|nr:urease accessory protein UreD [Dyadobacter sp. CY356]MCF0056082.1 urease accessory protein UreD [Dyadobacter sp. CY356]
MIAALHIHAALRGKATYLKRSYFSPPLKLADITENRSQKSLHLMQMSSSPGILDNDQFEIRIELEENCHLQLHTQSYQRLFTMKMGARQTMTVNLAAGASFIYLPHPAVPQANSIFTTRNKIYLAQNCRLIWGDIITCGRKLNGEIFEFSKYHAVTEVLVENRLVIKENICLIPDAMTINAIGQLEGFTHQASLIFLEGRKDCSALTREATLFLETQGEIIFGITAAPVSGLLVRILGNKSEQLINCLKSLTKIFTTED